MQFDKSRAYTSLNADELRAGDKVIVGDTLAELKDRVSRDFKGEIITGILDEERCVRFEIGDNNYTLAYLIERKENCTNCDMGEMDEDDWIGCSPDKIGKEDVAKTWCCDNWKPKTKQKAESHYRPFKNTDELIKVWLEKGGKWQKRELTMPYIWVKRKNFPKDRGTLITSLDDDIVYVGICQRTMDELFDDYTFLDGSPCGVEE